MTAVVVGAGLAGLLAARRLRQSGHEVVVLEAADSPGGMIRRTQVGALTVDGGAEAYATRSPQARELCAELGLQVAAPQGSPHVWWPDTIVPLAEGVLGIPGSLDDPAIAILSADERARLAQDLTLGPEVGRDATTAGQLVEARMGRAAVDKLVGPLAKGVYHSSPDALPLATFAPRLTGALAEHGSLLAAVAALRTPRSAAVEQPVGGMFRLVDALAEGADVRTGVTVRGLRREGDRLVVDTDGGRFEADRVVVCTPAAQARELLSGVGVTVDEAPTNPTRVVLLASDHPGLADNPVGSGLLLGEPDPRILARALTHYSCKWPWVEGGHVLRLSYPAGVEPTEDQAVQDASRLTKLALDGTITGFTTLAWEMPGKLDPGARDRVLADAAAAGVDVLGAWLDGNGISSIIEAGARIA